MHRTHHAKHHLHRNAHHDSAEEGNVATLERPNEALAPIDRRQPSNARPTSDKIQPFDGSKGWDERLYDMRRGEIGVPSIPNPHAPKVAPVMSQQSTGLCVECGKGVAPGQNYVCRDHVRAS